MPTYYGTKGGGQGTRGTGKWIASLLPWQKDSLYVEPLCGLAGVFLLRPPCRKELLNDLDGEVTNLLRVVRDDTDELERLCYATPKWSRPDFKEAWDVLEAPPETHSPAKSAWAFLIVSSWSLMQTRIPYTYPKLTKDGAQAKRLSDYPWSALAERLSHAMIEEIDALVLMQKLAPSEHVVGYCDPPYRYASTYPYKATIDHDDLTEMLLRQAGRWAVSGYEDDYPGLDDAGWQKHRHTTWLAGTQSRERSARVECLWTNYQTGQLSLW